MQKNKKKLVSTFAKLPSISQKLGTRNSESLDDPCICSVRRLTFDAPKLEQISTAIIADLFWCIERFAFRNGEISSLFTSC